ncbi:hypothetical protein C8R43DRAFT_960527 [Mycena crocata]|nr:hypothetical protein C8R43DRAFT_960527 [Mycena crocata]
MHRVGIRFALAPSPDLDWLETLRRETYPDQGRAHVSIVPQFNLQQDEYNELRERTAELAVHYRQSPVVFCDTGVYPWKRGDTWVAIGLRPKSKTVGSQICDEVWAMCMEINPCTIPCRRNYHTPHVSIFHGSGKNARVKILNWEVGDRLERRKRKKMKRTGQCHLLEVRATGLEIFQGDKIDYFPFPICGFAQFRVVPDVRDTKIVTNRDAFQPSLDHIHLSTFRRQRDFQIGHLMAAAFRHIQTPLTPESKYKVDLQQVFGTSNGHKRVCAKRTDLRCPSPLKPRSRFLYIPTVPPTTGYISVIGGRQGPGRIRSSRTGGEDSGGEPGKVADRASMRAESKTGEHSLKMPKSAAIKLPDLGVTLAAESEECSHSSNKGGAAKPLHDSGNQSS